MYPAVQAFRPMPQVVVSELRKRYNGTPAVDGVSFEVEKGQIFGLLGPNGAGKTTTVECLLGLREPDAGTIAICGLDARRHPREVKQKVGAALQTTALQAQITAREALTLYGGFYGAATPPAALLDRFQLTDKADVPFDTLSGGQRQPSRWHWRSCTSPRSCCSTSPRPGSIHRPGASCTTPSCA